MGLCFLGQTRVCKHYKASLEKLAFSRELSHPPLSDYSASEEDAYLSSPKVNAEFAAAILLAGRFLGAEISSKLRGEKGF